MHECHGAARTAAAVGAPRQPRRAAARSSRATSTSIYGEKHALNDCRLDIPERAVTAFIGPSGCGKSTFLRCINRMNDTIAGCARHRRDQDRRPGHLRPRRSTSCSCAPASAWCSRSRTRSRSRSTRTSPTARASTAWRAARPSSTRSSMTSLQARRPVGGGQGPARRSRHRPVRRPAAAPVHRARHRGQPGGHPDGRAVLGARSDRHRADRGADRRAARRTSRIIIVTHSMQQAARVSQRTAFFHLGDAGRGRARPSRSSPRRSDKRTQDYITGRFG